MDNQQIIQAIQSKYPDKYSSEKISSSLEKMSPVIKKALVEFLQNHQHPQINLEGYTVEKLVNESGMNEIAAYLTLDWIIREPEQALDSLKKGHDFTKF